MNPTYRKRQKVEEQAAPSAPPPHIIAQFKSVDGEAAGPQLDIPVDVTPEQLDLLINELLSNSERLPYSFYIDKTEISSNLRDVLASSGSSSSEQVLTIVYQPQAIFRVSGVTRCSSTLPGHSEAILSCSFSPSGKTLATGSGDAAVRLWDTDTQTPSQTLTGHKNWILAVAWSPDGKRLASGSKDCEIRVWNPETGEQLTPAPLSAHRKYITSLSWEPYHRNQSCTRFVSGSKDGTAKVWDTATGRMVFSLSTHTAGVSCVRWGGQGFIYTASQDRSIRVWDDSTGALVRVLEGHAHWINTMALSTDHALRTGPYSYTGTRPESDEEALKGAVERYEAVNKATGGERLVSGSDDFTLFLWQPTVDKKPIARMTGHQQLVNQVSFSPDGRLVASASFDKSVKLWDGLQGKYVGTLRGHVGAVYQVCWSADSRLICSGSKDSTLKVWDVKKMKLHTELPGHADEVYSVDWSPDGERVASGGKDRNLKLWMH